MTGAPLTGLRVWVAIGHEADRPEIARAEAETATAVLAAVERLGAQAVAAPITVATIGAFGRRVREQRPDVVVNLCESLGADSRSEALLPWLLDLSGIAYTGTDGVGLELALHKDKAAAVARGAGVPTPGHVVVGAGEPAPTPAQLHQLGFPVIVKPAHEDASLGIDHDAVTTDPDTTTHAINRLRHHNNQPILIERYIHGRELNVAILGQHTLPIREIHFGPSYTTRPHIVTYRAKWDPDSPDYTDTTPQPAQLDPDTQHRIHTTALTAFHATGCRDYGRVDIRLSPDGTPYVIDINPNCDLHPHAGYATTAATAGITYDQLIHHLITLALQRNTR